MPSGDDDDDQLWLEAMRQVAKFGDANRHAERPVPVLPRRRAAAPLAPLPDQRGSEVDRRTQQKFERGRMEIDGRIDLHGMTLGAAHHAVRDFVLRHYSAGSRCLLVITGKGERQTTEWYESARGGIRRHLQAWLDAEDLRPRILSCVPARPEHGGSGAFYLLLRRQRPISG